MGMLALIIGLIVSVGALFGASILVRKLSSGDSDGETKGVLGKINEVDEKLAKLSKRSSGYASKGQLQNLEQMLTKVAADLENEKATLVTVEKKLASAQKEVEAKEFQQQEVKAAKEEDENKLAELLSNFKDLSSESIELEQKLAQSMKNLDKILSEINVTEDQRAVLNNLNDSLTSAGSLLRELITESEMVNERLKVLKEQHSDLEEEYTRLVEQQLGE